MIRKNFITSLILFISIITITGCTHNNQNDCFESFGGHIVWNKNFSIKFDNKFKKARYPTCTKNKNLISFLLGISVNDKAIKREEGNSSVIEFNLTSFEEKLNSNQVNNTVNSFSNKYFLEVKSLSKNNARFSQRYSKTSGLIRQKGTVCRNVMTSVKDYKASNTPANQDYLLQNDFYKTCFLEDYNQIVVLSISYRITPDLEKRFWPQDFINKLNLFSQNVVMNDGKSLANLIKVNKKEILNLK